ncbi:unnamed protein product [Gordionus sp. m RMFG-2023]
MAGINDNHLIGVYRNNSHHSKSDHFTNSFNSLTLLVDEQNSLKHFITIISTSKDSTSIAFLQELCSIWHIQPISINSLLTKFGNFGFCQNLQRHYQRRKLTCKSLITLNQLYLPLCG